MLNWPEDFLFNIILLIILQGINVFIYESDDNEPLRDLEDALKS